MLHGERETVVWPLTMVELGDGLAQQLQPALLRVEDEHAAVRSGQAGAQILHSVDVERHIEHLGPNLGRGQGGDVLLRSESTD